LYFAAAFAVAGGTLVLAGDAPVVGGAAPASAVSAPFLFVTNTSANSVTEYAQGANGDATPVAILVGPHTALNSPSAAALDSTGRLYVGNFTPSITEYAAGANGDSSPSATIQGGGSGLGNPHGEGLDPSGNLWVANPLFNVNSVTEYANPTAGPSTPTATISGTSTGLNGPNGLAVASDGTIVVANSGAPGGGSITFYAPSPTGNVAPIRTIAGTSTGLNIPRGLALDSAGNIFVANELAGSVTEYPAGSSGNQAPTITIAGTNTGLAAPEGLAVDSDGHIYVANFGADSNGVGLNSVTEYAAGVTGNVSPIATIRGSHTGINGPVGLAVVRTAPANPGPNCTAQTSICITGQNIPGSIYVPAGKSLVLTNSTVGGTVTASNPSSITVCNSTVNGSMTISGATGFVLLGDPGDDNCPGNTLRGNVTLQNNAGGLELASNHISGNTTVAGNSGFGRVPGEDDRPEIEVNTIGGYLACSGNSPGVKNDGPPNNTVSGARSGQCAAPF
jgi:hypothetical protein